MGYINDYSDRIEAMGLAAIPGSTAVSDWAVGQSGSRWMSIKLNTQTVINRDVANNRTLWELNYTFDYVYAPAITGKQGVLRENLNDDIEAITTYFDTQINMTTATLSAIQGHWPGSQVTNLTVNGIAEDREGNSYRAATFSTTFRHQVIVERNI